MGKPKRAHQCFRGALAPSLPLMGRVARSLERAGWGDAPCPHPDAAKGVVGPPHEGEVWSLLLRYDQTCVSVAAARQRQEFASFAPRHEGDGAPKSAKSYGSASVAGSGGRLSARQSRCYPGPAPLSP
jgi:hypothetical protein